MTRVLALLVLAVTASAQTQQPCTTHSDCTEQQYCSDYTSEAGTNIVSCYPCVDAYQFTCSEYGDSVDASCAQCAEEEAAHGEGSYNYINCESSATCAENMYCYRTNFDGFVVQDCWPCADSNGYSCEDYGDAVDGNCSSCVGSLPATNGCTTHAECSAGSYCSSYQNAAGTGIIVTCNPCVDSYGYTCQDYDDPVDGSCEICAGIEGPSAGGGDFGIGGPPPSSAPAVDLACHANPIAPETSVAFQSCSGHGDCRKGEYCSAYMGNAGCVIDCWPCTDMYGLSCTDYGDSIDMKCETCAAKEDKGAAPASSEPAAAAADTGCKAHAECPSEHYCATIGDHTHCVECAGESNATTTCQLHEDSIDGSCSKCSSSVNVDTESTSVVADEGEISDKWQTFGVVIIVLFALSACGAMCYTVYRVWKAKYGKDDALALRGVVNVRRDNELPAVSRT